MKTATEIASIRLTALYVLADRERANGMEVKRGIEDLTGAHVDNPPVYTTLRDLCEDGLVTQEKRNATRGKFWLTEDGRELLEEHHAWFSKCLDDSVGQQTF